MKKMTIRKMLERIVVATNKRRAKNIVLVSTDGEIVEAPLKTKNSLWT